MRKLIIGALASGAAISMAIVLDTGQLTPYVNAMGSVQSLDIAYSINDVGGTQTKYHVVLAKPDKAMVDTPSMTYVADGKNVTVFNKVRNTYFKKAQTKQSLAEMFDDEETAVWKPFFDPKAFDGVAKTKMEGTRSRGGEQLKTVSAQIDAKGEYTVKLHIAQSDNLLRQAEFINVKGGQTKVRILNVEKMGKDADPSMFAFSAPTGAKELSEAEMMSAEWLTDLDQALELAAALNKGVIIDVYADW